MYVFATYLFLISIWLCHCHIFAVHQPILRQSKLLYSTHITKAASDVAAGRQGPAAIAGETGGGVICRRFARLILVTITGLSRRWQRHSRMEEWLKRYTDIKMPLHWEMIADHLAPQAGTHTCTHTHIPNDCFVLSQYKNCVLIYYTIHIYLSVSVKTWKIAFFALLNPFRK